MIGLPQSGKTILFYALTRGEGSPAGDGGSALVSANESDLAGIESLFLLKPLKGQCAEGNEFMALCGSAEQEAAKIEGSEHRGSLGARGFIRAEDMAFDGLIVAKTWDAAKAAGKLQLEGKDYPVKDGDIVHIRFKV